MKTIKINGQAKLVASVDDDDYPYLSRFNWFLNKDGYVVRYVGKDGSRQQILMSELLIERNAYSNKQIIYKNHDLLNLQKDNLALATVAERILAGTKRKGTASKYRGVSKYRSLKTPWRASISYNKKQIHLGYFDNELDAHNAYLNKRLELYGI